MGKFKKGEKALNFPPSGEGEEKEEKKDEEIYLGLLPPGENRLQFM